MIFGKHVNRFYLKYGIFFLIGIAALVTVDYVQLLIPDVTGSIIEGLEAKTLTEAMLGTYIKDIIIWGLIIVFGRFVWRIFIMGTSRRIDYELRNKMFEHAEKLSRRFYQENKSGGLMSYFTNDLEAVRMAFGPGLMMAFDILFLGSMAFIKMYQLDQTLTFFALVPLLMVSLLSAFVSRITGRKFKARQKAFEEMSDFTQENFYGISVIKAFVNEVRQLRAFNKINTNNYDKSVSHIKASTLMHVGIEMFITVIRILMLAIGGWLVYKTVGVSELDPAKFSIGDLTRYIAYFGTMVWPMMAVGRLINMRAQAKASLSRLSNLLDQPIEIKDDPNSYKGGVIEGKIVFNHVNFKYPGTKQPALRDVVFTIEKGQMVGIIGRTGSGKTTLVDLLLRLYNLKSNEIMIDDVDIMKWPIRTIRDAIGYVPQDNFIFSDTVMNNIAFAVDDASEEQIEEVARYSDIHDNILDFPNQYETLVGERGVTLSGGQKQRLSIARALIKDPTILIMDDSFSAVDTKTEEMILNQLRSLRSGKTTLIIAHRISTIKQADLIVLVDDGQIIGLGTHDELLMQSPFYQQLVLQQQLEDEIEGVA